MPKSYEYRIGEVVASAPTKTAAREACERKAALLCTDNALMPSLVCGGRAVVYRNTDGFCYAFPDESKPRGFRALGGGYSTLTGAESAAAFHVAQNAYGTPAFAEVLALAHECMTPDAASNLHSWIRFQDAYKAARDRGLNDEQAREACRDVY